MDSATRSRLHDVTLQARQLLVSEVQQMLEGVYGLHRSGSFEPASNLPAVQSLPEVRQTWERLKNYLADERDAGLKPEEAHSKLAKEVAFTWLNRLVAFKMLEARRLVRGTLDRYHDSNAFKFYLSDHPQDLTLFNAGDATQDALGERPRDVAYRHFLLDQCRDMAGQIKVLFDPDNLPSHLFPRPRALRDLITLLNDPSLAEAWQPGSEEAVGWVYQYFNELEKAQIYARLSKGGKVSYGEIPIITQLYTPRWIVRALAENSLGRLWLKLHPKSRLKEQMSYLIPMEKDESLSQRDEEPEVRLAKTLTFLDPACGSMHFGIVAFDLLFQMYQEEFENAGRHGWPEVPSVSDPMDIPASIIANNLFGIDIDPRAVQLSALALLLKARSYNPRARITDHNLACADILLGDAPKLSRLISAIKEKHPTLGRILQAVSAELGKTHLLGSLTPEGGELQKAIEAERIRYEAERMRPHLPGMVPEEYVFEAEADSPDFWTNLEDRAIDAFEQVAQYIDERDQQKGISEEYFTDETVKALRFARIIFLKYDVVATNPPYLSNRVLPDEIRDPLNKRYPDSKSDFYTAFIERCCSFARSQATVAMITQQSFMFISSYEKLRAKLRQRVAIRAMVHTGPHAFAEIGGEKVNTTLFVLDKQLSPTHRDNAVGIYFRLIKAPRAEAKRTGFEHALGRLRAGDSDEAVYRYRQGDFDAIPGAPWVYWITSGLKELFRSLPSLENVAQPRQGLATADNARFLRYWWEVGTTNVGYSYASWPEAKASLNKWFPYMKGGSFQRWWGNQE
ncbi:MAG TPA: BREX-1 system adenine-specific DNA-methyltransferase PglX, partial [Chloroflexia bacterium]